MKTEPLVTRALEDAIAHCEWMADFGPVTPRVVAGVSALWRTRGDEYRQLLKKLKPAKSVRKRGRR